MNILLTGGTGFIGSHILIKLLAEGHQIEILARNPNKIPRLLTEKNISITKGDITNTNLFDKIAKGKDICIYVAYLL